MLSFAAFSMVSSSHIRASALSNACSLSSPSTCSTLMRPASRAVVLFKPSDSSRADCMSLIACSFSTWTCASKASELNARSLKTCVAAMVACKDPCMTTISPSHSFRAVTYRLVCSAISRSNPAAISVASRDHHSTFSKASSARNVSYRREESLLRRAFSNSTAFAAATV